MKQRCCAGILTSEDRTRVFGLLVGLGVLVIFRVVTVPGTDNNTLGSGHLASAETDRREGC